MCIRDSVNTKSELLTLDKNQSSFQKRGFFPLTDEKLRIGEFKSNGKLRGSDVVLQFSPSKILGFDTSYHPKTVLKGNQYAAIGISVFKDDAIETLDEVQLYAKKEYTKMEKLKNASFGKITEFGEEERRFYKTFAQFITGRGFEVDETQYVNEATQESSRFRIETRNPVSINATKIPIIYLDDAFLVDFDILYQFSMEQVDYVIVNKSGIGEGVRGGAGVIRIYTDPFKKFQQPKKISFTEYTIPLTYSTPKRFYIPEEDKWVTLKVSTSALKTINKIGITAALKEAKAKGLYK